MNTVNFIRCIRPREKFYVRTAVGQPFTFAVSEDNLEFYTQCLCAALSVSRSEINIAIERFTRIKDNNASLYADILKEPEFLFALMARLWQACIFLPLRGSGRASLRSRRPSDRSCVPTRMASYRRARFPIPERRAASRGGRCAASRGGRCATESIASLLICLLDP